MAFAENAWTKPQPKPAKGAAAMERKERRRGVEDAEEANKAEVRKRDKKCRLPHCPYCKRYKGLTLHCAHVIAAKGYGGDSTLIRSQPNQMMQLCSLAHGAQEQHVWDVVPLTDRGTDEICDFYLVEDVYDPETSAYSTRRLLWAREVAIGLPQHPQPLVPFRLVKRKREEPD